MTSLSELATKLREDMAKCCSGTCTCWRIGVPSRLDAIQQAWEAWLAQPFPRSQQDFRDGNEAWESLVRAMKEPGP